MTVVHASGGDAAPRPIALAPLIDLHTGYHGAICSTPPSGFAVEPVSARHVFLMRAGTHSPSLEAHLAECIRVPDPQRPVHSARWPVLDCPAWLADCDDLVYPVVFGRTALDLKLGIRARNGCPDTLALLRARADCMLGAYLHPSCSAILLRGHPYVRTNVAREWFAHLGLAAKGDDALAKVTIVQPAQQALPMRAIEAKWSATAPTRVLFCGREFDGKNGLLALEVMCAVMNERPDVEFCYVGPIPSHVQSTSPRLLERIAHFEHLDRRGMLEQMALAHVFFHPSKHESIGIALLEAMGAGAAVVTAVGESTEYSAELFREGGALLLERRLVPPAEERHEFIRLMLAAVGNLGHMRAMGLHNHRATLSGKYSISAQCAALGQAYERLCSLHGPALNAASMAATSNADVMEMNPSQLAEDMRRARHRNEMPSPTTAIVV